MWQTNQTKFSFIDRHVLSVQLYWPDILKWERLVLNKWSYFHMRECQCIHLNSFSLIYFHLLFLLSFSVIYSPSTSTIKSSIMLTKLIYDWMIQRVYRHWNHAFRTNAMASRPGKHCFSEPRPWWSTRYSYPIQLSDNWVSNSTVESGRWWTYSELVRTLVLPPSRLQVKIHSLVL